MRDWNVHARHGRRGHERRRALLALIERVNSSHDLSVVLSHILDGVAEVVRCPTVWVCLPSGEDGESYSVAATRGEGAPRVGTSVPWRRIARVEEVGSEPAPRELNGGTLSAVDPEDAPLARTVLPMKKGGGVVGLLGIARERWKGPYSAEETDLLHVVCNHAALAIAYAELHLRHQRLTEQLTEQLQERVDDQMRSLLDANERLRRMHEQASRLATVDGLTGLHNHRYFWQRLSEEMARARRFRRPFSLLFMDVDGLKEVNDLHGHIVGDRLLKRLSEVIGGETRSCDVAARYGGDEFAVLLTESDVEAAAAVARRLRGRAQLLSVPDEEGKAVVATFSLGTATYPLDGETEWELLHAADQAAYREKRRTRGQE